MPGARPSDVSSSLARLATLWRMHEDGPARRAQTALVVAAFLATAHLARLGTPLGRGIAIGIVAGLLVAFVAKSILHRATFRSPRATLRKTVGKADPTLGRKAIRALGLIEQSERDPQASSPELSRLHFDRILQRVGEERIEARAATAARRWQYLGIFAGVLAIGAVLRGPFRVVEGLDVLFAQEGEAPLPFDWLDEVYVVASPPAYLHQNDRFRMGFGRMSLPRGSTLTLRGKPVHEGRQIVLYDREQEIPFVSDGSGGLVARFTLGESTTLGIAARFGDVRIRQAGSLDVISIPDETPLVLLEGAPRQVRLLEEPEVTVAYEARDDHGLREIHLVLRAGGREDRRVLAKLDGETRVHRGAMRLRSSDPFFLRTYVPVELTVEARDDDPITGPKWGRSEALILMPPALGEPEALRYAALERARDAFIDLLAFRTEAEVGKTRAEKRAHVEAESSEAEKALAALADALGGLHGGRSLPRRTSLVLRSETSKLDAALAAEARRTTSATHEKLLTLTEDAVLTFDTALRALGARDAAAVSKKLADVADDAVRGAELAQSPADRARGQARISAATEVLEEGGTHLSRLGSLGADLGEIVENGVRRIRRAQGQDDFFHAELAARDLAARLRNPVPSFSGGGGGGVEAGGGAPDPSGDGSEAGDVEGEIARQQRDLEDLARDHAAELAEVERALREATNEEALRDVLDEARKRAERLREAADGLRHLSGGPETAESSASTGREHAEAMAGALERGSMADAVESGRQALRALEEAERKPSAFTPFDDARVHELARRARGEVAEQLAFAEKALDELRAQASEAARERLKEAAKREGKLAERAREIGRQGQDGPAAMPEELLDLLKEAEGLMREAERALDGAEGEKALDKQRNAQRLLERARESGDDGEEGSPDGRMAQNDGRDGQREGEGDDPRTGSQLPIPSADQHKGPEAFRKRVMEGLGGSSDPRLKDAVKRYAEGLLR